MTVLVTGGAGFIGGHLAERFLQAGRDVVVLDSMHPYYDLRIKEHTLDRHREVAGATGVEYEFVEGDVRDVELVTDLVRDADYVYHQAARAGVRDSVTKPRTYDFGRSCRAAGNDSCSRTGRTDNRHPVRLVDERDHRRKRVG